MDARRRQTTIAHSDFIAIFGIQPVPFEIGNTSQLCSSDWEKNLRNCENTGLFWIGKQPVFGCKIGKIKSLAHHS